MTEQRQHSRASALIRAAFTVAGDPPRQSIVSNISLGGAWLDMTENQPGVGSEGKLHAVVGQVNLYVIAKVVRQTPRGIGVTFIDMGIETYGSLKQLVEHLDARKQEPQQPA